LEVLRGIGRDLLSRFFFAFTSELAESKIEVPGADVGDTEFFTQVATLFSSGCALPTALMTALSAIALMVAGPRLPSHSPHHHAHHHHHHHRPPTRYSIRRGLRIWHVTFDAQVTDIHHERGMFYAAELLLNPPEQPIHAIELIAKIPEFHRKQLGLTQICDPSSGKVLPVLSGSRMQQRSLSIDDAQAVRALLRKQKELETILDSDGASEPEKAEALRELEPLYQFLRTHSSRTRDSAQNAADTVRTALWRLQRRLSNAVDTNGQPHPVLRPFGEHLLRFILLPSARQAAGCFTYEPPPGVFWVSR
jgi:hypothetical protein